MANNLIQLKRTSVSGRAANTVTLPNAGELALNMADGILYSTNGATVFEIGANNTNVNVTNTLTVAKLSANGSTGTAGQVLTSNGTTVYWTTPASGGVNTDAQYTWSNTQNFQANVTFGSSSPSKNVNITMYTNKLAVYSDPSQAPGGGLFSSYGLELTQGPITLYDSAGSNGQVITSNGTVATWQNLPAAVVNVNAQYTWTNTQTFTNTITFSQTINGTANNASYLGGTIASGYQTTAGLASNVATLTSNNATYAFGKSESALNVNSALTSNNSTYAFGKSESSLNVNSALTSNNSTYAFGKTEGNLNVNSALTSNNSTYAFGKSESALNVNSALTANNSNNLGGVAAASYVNTTGSYTISGVHTYSGNVVLQSGLSANGGFGTAGQLLYSNGTTGSPYWAAAPSATVNTAAQYTWTNTQTFANNVTINNDKRLSFQTVNTSASAAFTQQSDDNFVFYTTNTSYGTRAVYSIYANSNSSEFSFQVPVRFNANVTVLVANGSQGSPGQVLASDGTNVYWVSPGAASVNTAAQFSWSNIHTFSANVNFTGNNITVVSNTGSVMFAGAGDVNWRIGRNTGATTKWRYSNNTLDILAANSNLEGVVIGNPLASGTTYFETGHLGTYIASNVTIGNTSSNSIINSTAFSGTANNATYAFGKTEGALNVNNSVTSNTANTATYIIANTGLVSNSSGVFVNSSYIGTLSANNASYLGGTIASGYQTTAGLAANVATLAANSATYVLANNGIISNASGVFVNGNTGLVVNSTGVHVNTSALPAASVNLDSQYVWTNTHTFTNTVFLNAVSANGSLGTAGQVLTSNGSDTYWSTASGANASISGTSQSFTANGTGDTFVLSTTPSNISDIVVSLNGLIQSPTTHYTLSGNTVTFTSVPPNNGIVEVRSFSGTGGATSSAPTMQVFTYSVPAGTWSRGASKTGTTTRSSTTVTATVTNHGYSVGDLLYLDATSGTITDQFVEVATVPTTNTFTCAIDSAAGTGGNATFYPGVVITANGHGLANGATVFVNFAQIFDDNYYTVYKANSSTFQVEPSSVTQGLSNTGSVTFETLNSTQTWTKPAGCRSVWVRVVGGGGAANNVPASLPTDYVTAGGGYSEEIVDVSAVSNVSVTIGKGGKSYPYTASINDGGTSSFGSYLSATGSSKSTPGNGSGGTLNVKGFRGSYQQSGSPITVFPGSSVLGGDTYGIGGNVSYDGCGWTVANGSPGVIIVTEYY